MYKKLVTLIVLFLLLGLMLDFGLGTGLSSIKGLSFKNVAIYLMIITLVTGSLTYKKKLIQPNSINKPILFFIGYNFFSMLYTYMSGNAGQSSFSSNLIDFKSFTDPFILAIILYSLVDDMKTIKVLVISLLLVFFAFNFLTIIGSLNIAQIRSVEFDARLGKSSGAFGEPNQYAAFVSLFIPLCIAALFNFKSVFRKIAITIFLLSGLYCILLTGSRGGLLSLVIGLFALNALNAKRKLLDTVFKSGVGLLAIGILIVITFSFLPEEGKLGLHRNIVERATEQDLEHYSSSRTVIWLDGLKLFIHYPIFGSGWGTFVRMIHVNSHNDYLLYLATTGVIGFYLFVLIFYRLFQSINLYRNIGGDNNLYYNGYIAGLISFCTSMFFVNTMSPLYFFFIYSALILKMGYLEKINYHKTEYAKMTIN